MAEPKNKAEAYAQELIYRHKLRKSFKEATDLLLQITLDETLKEINRRNKPKKHDHKCNK